MCISLTPLVTYSLAQFNLIYTVTLTHSAIQHFISIQIFLIACFPHNFAGNAQINKYFLYDPHTLSFRIQCVFHCIIPEYYGLTLVNSTLFSFLYLGIQGSGQQWKRKESGVRYKPLLIATLRGPFWTENESKCLFFTVWCSQFNQFRPEYDDWVVASSLFSAQCRSSNRSGYLISVCSVPFSHNQ